LEKTHQHKRPEEMPFDSSSICREGWGHGRLLLSSYEYLPAGEMAGKPAPEAPFKDIEQLPFFQRMVARLQGVGPQVLLGSHI